MPLPPEIEVEVQSRMSNLAKILSPFSIFYPEIYLLMDSIRRVRREMTRIHLGNEIDIAGGFFNMATFGEDPKFKYGYGDMPNLKQQKSEDTDKWRKNAIHYQDTIAKTNEKFRRNNEITIKYRKHAGNFPIITELERHGSGPDSYIYKWNEIERYLGFNKKRTVTDLGKIE